MTNFVVACFRNRKPAVTGLSSIARGCKDQTSFALAILLAPYWWVDALDAAARIHRAVVDGMTGGIF